METSSGPPPGSPVNRRSNSVSDTKKKGPASRMLSKALSKTVHLYNAPKSTPIFAKKKTGGNAVPSGETYHSQKTWEEIVAKKDEKGFRDVLKQQTLRHYDDVSFQSDSKLQRVASRSSNTTAKSTAYASKTMKPDPKGKQENVSRHRRTQSEPFMHSWDFTFSAKATPHGPMMEEPTVKSSKESELDTKLVKASTKSDKKLELMHKQSSKGLFKDIKVSQDITVETTNGKDAVVSGTLEALMDHLVTRETQDILGYVEPFLLSYRCFTTGQELFEGLVKRYNQKMEDLPPKIAEKVQNTIKLRVIIVIKTWVEGHFSDFVAENLFGPFNQFYERTLVKSKNEKWGKMLVSTISKKFVEFHIQNISAVAVSMSSESGVRMEIDLRPIQFKGSNGISWMKTKLAVKEDDAVIVGTRLVKYNLISPVEKQRLTWKKNKDIAYSKSKNYTLNTHEYNTKTLLDFQPIEIARQLALKEHDIFKSIKLHEFTNKNWSNRKEDLSPNIKKLIALSNDVGYFVACEVVTTPNLRKRVTVLKHFISIAKHCLRLNCFNALSEVMSGLSMGMVQRLKDTWKSLPAKYVETFLELDQVISSDENFKAYRRLLGEAASERGAFLPQLALVLKDLTFFEDGNPSVLANGHINFKKMQMLSSAYKLIRTSQERVFHLAYDAEIQYFLNHLETLEEKELYRQSKFIEPPGERIANRRIKRLMDFPFM